MKGQNMKEIRIAIIGTGMISDRHMTVINNLKKEGRISP